MAQPHKGPRRGFQIRWTEDDRRLVKARADAAGLTMTDYLLELVHRDDIDSTRRPCWAGAELSQQLPGLELTA